MLTKAPEVPTNVRIVPEVIPYPFQSITILLPVLTVLMGYGADCGS
jgi:hypothetical protein